MVCLHKKCSANIAVHAEEKTKTNNIKETLRYQQWLDKINSEFLFFLWFHPALKVDRPLICSSWSPLKPFVHYLITHTCTQIYSNKPIKRTVFVLLC